MPPTVRGVLANFAAQAPGWTQVYASDKDIEQHLATLEGEAALAAYKCMVPGAFKSDLWRLLVLCRWGGVYADLGFTLLAGLESFVDVGADELVLVRDRVHDFRTGYIPRVYQAFMGAHPGHPVMQLALHRTMDMIQHREYGVEHLDITGPTVVGRVLATFFGAQQGQVQPRGQLPHGRFVWRAAGASYAVALLTFNHVARFSHLLCPQGRTVLLTKFPNYYKVLYDSRGKTHYSTLWNQRRVYVEDVQDARAAGNLRHPPQEAWPLGTVTLPEFMRHRALGDTGFVGGPSHTGVTHVWWRSGEHAPVNVPDAARLSLQACNHHSFEWMQVYAAPAHREWFLGQLEPKAAALLATSAGDDAASLHSHSTLWALFVLRDVGGVYMDLGFTLLQPVNSLRAFTARGTDPHLVLCLAAGGGSGTYKPHLDLLGAKARHPVLVAMCYAALQQSTAKAAVAAATSVLAEAAAAAAAGDMAGDKWVTAWLQPSGSVCLARPFKGSPVCRIPFLRKSQAGKM
jgi:mannosyltransferase OCH1-like enzyme